MISPIFVKFQDQPLYEKIDFRFRYNLHAGAVYPRFFKKTPYQIRANFFPMGRGTAPVISRMIDTVPRRRRRTISHFICLYNFLNIEQFQTFFYCSIQCLGRSVGCAPAGLTYVFAKGVSDQVRDPLTPRNSLQ